MKTLIDHLANYAAYHRDARNVFSHFIGIPMIVLAVTTLLARPAMPLGDGAGYLTPAMVVYGLSCLFYLRLSAGFGLAMTAILAGFVYVGGAIAALSTGAACRPTTRSCNCATGCWRTAASTPAITARGR